MTPASLFAGIRFGQSRTYGGFYLALAEELSVNFYTGDRRLFNLGQQFGLAWIPGVGEDTAG